MICITGQIESTEWNIAQNGTAVCIGIPVKAMQWVADSLSFSIQCAEPHLLSWFVCGVSRVSTGFMLSADVMQAHSNYLLNESEPEFYKLCLTVSRFVRKMVRSVRRRTFSGFHKSQHKPSAALCLTGVLRL